MSVRVVLEEISIWIGELSKEDPFTKAGGQYPVPGG